jgi:ATP-dependent RNA helicase MRH4
MNRTVANIPPPETISRKNKSKDGAHQSRTKEDWLDKKKNASRSRSSDRGPFHALKMQRILTQIGYGARNALKRRIEDIDSFGSFPLLPAVQEAISSTALLGDLETLKPTAIQRVAIPALLGVDVRAERKLQDEKSSFNSYLLAAETGSGKTLAYLVPCVDSLKRADEVQKAEDYARENSTEEVTLAELAEREYANKTGQPRVVILVPTAELVNQVGSVAKSLGHTIKFRTGMISSAQTASVIRSTLNKPGGNDVLVATPQLLLNIVRSEPSMVARVSHLVIDEADSLLDRSFQAFTEEIIERCEPSLKRLIMCSATIPRKMDGYVRKNYPNALRLTTPNLHAIPRRVQLSVVDVNAQNYLGSKDAACADTIWNIGYDEADEVETAGRSSGELDLELEEPKSLESAVQRKIRKILVFVNEREKTTELAKYLVGKGIDATALNRDGGARTDGQVLKEFTGTAAPEKAGEQQKVNDEMAPKRRRLQNTKVLVTTDIASRGIDTTPVRDVILYDVPHTTIDFIHRLGRVGRMGRRGRGIVLVGKDDRKDVVSEVRHGMFLGQALI